MTDKNYAQDLPEEPNSADPTSDVSPDEAVVAAAAEAIAEAATDLPDAADYRGDHNGVDESDANRDTELAAAQAEAAERLADLQRLQAEYVNYRKRVERDRAVAGEQAMSRAVESLIPTLDDVLAAKAHGDLEDGPFAAIANKLFDTLRNWGWDHFGAAGEAFDPHLHDALHTLADTNVTSPTIADVAQPGHRLGEKILRPARVIVAQPPNE